MSHVFVVKWIDPPCRISNALLVQSSYKFVQWGLVHCKSKHEVCSPSEVWSNQQTLSNQLLLVSFDISNHSLGLFCDV